MKWPTLDNVRAEIEALHDFFVDWFGGAAREAEATFEARFLARFDPTFTLIPPAGRTLTLETLSAAIRKGYGGNPDFRIAIRAVREVARDGDLVVASYEEWQRAARKSLPPDNGRAATVVFRVTDGPEGPGLRWLHVHETWLPADVMAGGDYDF
jgi:hypothetical protein